MRPSIVHVLFDTARRLGDEPALRYKEEGAWRSVSWREYERQVRLAARGLMALGLSPGARVAPVGWNCPEWLILDLATMAAGGVPAPLYPNLPNDQARYILEHSGATILCGDDGAQVELRRGCGAGCVEHFVQMRGRPVGEETVGYEKLLALGESIPEAALEERLGALLPESLATLIYTSGTTGPPKGVMLTHRNLVFTARVGLRHLGLGEGERMISYLPLSHIAEQMLSIHLPVTAGITVHFGESLEVLGETLREVRPTAFLGVPRVWEKIQARMVAAGKGARGLRSRLVAWARRIGLKAAERAEKGRKSPALYGLADRLVYSKVRRRLGLDHCRLCYTAAAPIARSTQDFFFSLGIPLYEIYGLSEDSGPATVSTPDAFRRGFTGRALEGTQIRLAEGGEVLVRGEHVFAGYYRDPERTREALDEEGWLHTGDVGELEDGFLRITDRKKDLLITAGGKNVAPQLLEAELKSIPGIGQACVLGDRRKYLTALLAIDPQEGAAVAEEVGAQGVSPEALAADPAFLRHVEAAVEGINSRLARYETLKRFTVLPTEFTTEGGELTPTMKMKRSVVEERYAAAIEAMYPPEEL